MSSIYNVTLNDWNAVEDWLEENTLPSNIINNIFTAQTNLNLQLGNSLSKGQLASKIWLRNIIQDSDLRIVNLIICAGWNGILASILLNSGLAFKITNVDYDSRCKIQADEINKKKRLENRFEHLTEDILNIDYTQHYHIINTSCEHISNLDQWINLLPENRLVILQSNNFTSCLERINCVTSPREIIKGYDFKVILEGTLKLPDYERYTIGFRT